MSSPTAAQKAAALAQGTATIHTATTRNLNWGPEPGGMGLANTVIASQRFAGVTTPYAMQAPAPLRGESIDHYMDRVVGGNWTPGTGAMGWVNGMAEELTGDMIGFVAGALEDVANDVDPSGTVAGAIKTVNAAAQSGLSTDERITMASASDAQDAVSAPKTAAISPTSSKGKTMATLVFKTLPNASPSTVAAFGAALSQAASTQTAAQLAGVKAPPATPANPTAGRTIMGLPMVDVIVGGAVAVGGLALAKVKGWL